MTELETRPAMASQDQQAHPTIMSMPKKWPQRPSAHNFRSSKEVKYPDRILLPEINVPLHEVIQLRDCGTLIFSTDVSMSVSEMLREWEDRETEVKQSGTISRARSRARIRRVKSWHCDKMRSYKKPSFKAVELPISNANIQFPECSVDRSDIVFTNEGSQQIRQPTASKMLEKAIMWIDHEHEILRDENMLSLEPQEFPFFRNNHEIDILLMHITHGRWNWITNSRQVYQGYEPGPGEQLAMIDAMPWAIAINTMKTEQLHDARRACFSFGPYDQHLALRRFCIDGKVLYTDLYWRGIGPRTTLHGILELKRNYEYIDMLRGNLQRKMHAFKAIHEDQNQKEAKRAAEVARQEWLQEKKLHDKGCAKYPCEVKPRCSNFLCPDHSLRRMKKPAKECQRCLELWKLREEKFKEESEAKIKAQEDAQEQAKREGRGQAMEQEEEEEEEDEEKKEKKVIKKPPKRPFDQFHQSTPPPGWCCERENCSLWNCAEHKTCWCMGYCQITKSFKKNRPDPEEVPLPETGSREKVEDIYYRWRRPVIEIQAKIREAKKPHRAPDEEISSLEQSPDLNRTSITDSNTPPPSTPERNTPKRNSDSNGTSTPNLNPTESPNTPEDNSDSNRTSLTNPNPTESPNTEPCDSIAVSSTTDSSETRSSQVSSVYRNPASISTAADLSETASGQISSAGLNAQPTQQKPSRNSARNVSYRAKKFFKKALRRQSSPAASTTP